MALLSYELFLVPEKKEGRAYSRPSTGTWKSPHESAFDTPQLGRAEAPSRGRKFPGFVEDSSRSYAKMKMKN